MIYATTTHTNTFFSDLKLLLNQWSIFRFVPCLVFLAQSFSFNSVYALNLTTLHCKSLAVFKQPLACVCIRAVVSSTRENHTMSRRRASGLIKKEIKVDACYSQLRRCTAICQSQRCDCFGPAVIHCLSKYESEAACRAECAGKRSAASPTAPLPSRSKMCCVTAQRRGAIVQVIVLYSTT